MTFRPLEYIFVTIKEFLQQLLNSTITPTTGV